MISPSILLGVSTDFDKRRLGEMLKERKKAGVLQIGGDRQSKKALSQKVTMLSLDKIGIDRNLSSRSQKHFT
ncbi:MAG: hypothetical protein ACE5KZ_15405 [Candidatus Scalinduaceae bacterium]